MYLAVSQHVMTNFNFKLDTTENHLGREYQRKNECLHCTVFFLGGVVVLIIDVGIHSQV